MTLPCVGSCVLTMVRLDDLSGIAAFLSHFSPNYLAVRSNFLTMDWHKYEDCWRDLGFSSARSLAAFIHPQTNRTMGPMRLKPTKLTKLTIGKARMTPFCACCIEVSAYLLRQKSVSPEGQRAKTADGAQSRLVTTFRDSHQESGR